MRVRAKRGRGEASLRRGRVASGGGAVTGQDRAGAPPGPGPRWLKHHAGADCPPLTAPGTRRPRPSAVPAAPPPPRPRFRTHATTSPRLIPHIVTSGHAPGTGSVRRRPRPLTGRRRRCAHRHRAHVTNPAAAGRTQHNRQAPSGRSARRFRFRAMPATRCPFLIVVVVVMRAAE